MNILFLCTYPIRDPRHGGQLRVRNMVDKYRQAGHNIQVVGVLGSDHYPMEEGFVEYPGSAALSKVIENSFLMEDYAIGNLFAQNDDYFFSLVEKIKLKPDVVHVEHPWLFSFAKRYISFKEVPAKLIYSSHNVEWRLKQDILTSYMGLEPGQCGAELIESVEKVAINGADAIVCVSKNDHDWLKGQTSKPLFLAPNGVKRWQSTPEGRQEALGITQGYEYALYCASAHPPNVTGFFDMFGGGFGSLKPDEKLVAAGNIGWAIGGDERVHQSAKLAEKFVIGGEVSQSCLEGLLDGAKTIVLPLTQGGGTNLKTAEALWSGKYVVATTVAMRGFESFINTRGVFVANDAPTFKRALRTAMSLPPLVLSNEEIESRRCVLWESCLSSLDQMMEFIKPVNGGHHA